MHYFDFFAFRVMYAQPCAFLFVNVVRNLKKANNNTTRCLIFVANFV